MIALVNAPDICWRTTASHDRCEREASIQMLDNPTNASTADHGDEHGLDVPDEQRGAPRGPLHQLEEAPQHRRGVWRLPASRASRATSRSSASISFRKTTTKAALRSEVSTSPYWAGAAEAESLPEPHQVHRAVDRLETAHGNVYALKQRDQRGIVTALYILDPQRVTPLITADGDVYYKLKGDQIADVWKAVTVPAARSFTT
jgi:hypothetical protein